MRQVEPGRAGWICGLANICVNASITLALPPTPTSAQQELRLPLLQSKDQLAARRVSVVPGQGRRGRGVAADC